MNWYIYMAKERSINEGQGYESLILIDTKESWAEAYKIMCEEGEILRQRGWKEGCVSRSASFCDDDWLEPDHGQSWKDWHTIKLIASTSKLMLVKRKGDQR